MTDQVLRPSGSHQRGIALISALLLLLLMSALAVAMLYKVDMEQRLQKTDSGNNAAYYGAEAGMEKMIADLDSLYAQKASPTCADINNLETGWPSGLDVTYSQYLIEIPGGPCTTPPQEKRTISQGQNAGLMAYIVPLSLKVSADRPGGEQVGMIRQVEVALIPVFQFGVFSDSDLSFFPGPDFDFKGRVHTNGNLFLADESSLTFYSKVRAAGDVVRDQLANGAGTVAQGRTRPVYMPTSPTGTGCTGSKPSATCRDLTVTPVNEGSSIGGASATYGGTGTVNNTTDWKTLYQSTYNSMIMSGGTGAKPLHLEFVQSGVNPIEIIRRGVGESPTSATGQSRLYHKAQIRVLLSDDPNELPGGASDSQNIRLANVQTNSSAPDYSNGAPVPAGFRTYFAEASTAVQDTGAWTGGAAQDCLPSDWSAVPATPPPGSGSFTLMNYESNPVSVTDPQAAVFTTPTTGYAPYVSSVNPTSPNPPCFRTATQAATLLPAKTGNAPPDPGTRWNLLDGYLRVEIRLADGSYIPVTREWLELGFARGYNPPTASSPNTVNPNAILIFQQLADRNGNGSLDPQANGVESTAQVCTAYDRRGRCTSWQTVVNARGIERPAELQPDPDSGSVMYGAASGTNSVTRYNWYPINFYDAREGETREGTTSMDCRVGGVINVAEIDLRNLKRWLNGSISGSGTLVDQEPENGYVLYFSDRRGMLPNPHAGNVKNGEYGFEDVINPSSGSGGAPNGVLDTGEDADSNGLFDDWGKADLGFGFGAANSGDPFSKHVDCMNVARKNWISGARHAVRLVDGSQGNIPVRSDSGHVGAGGFTLVSENPAYILGDYNANSSNCSGCSGTNWTFTGNHAAAAVIADTVTLLSNSWTDNESFTSPTRTSGRNASTTYYRVAIATGKNRNFPWPSWSGTPGVPNDYGTDGGVHNFLRFLENWGGSSAFYMGSMVSLYYSQYATGVYKCCGTVYSPPTRRYAFDVDFTDIDKMPPGTPRLRDVVDVGFQQVF